MLNRTVVKILQSALLASMAISAAYAEGNSTSGDTLTGTLEVVYVDNVDFKGGKHEYFLNPGNKQVPVRMEFPGKAPENLKPGSRISIHGRAHGRVFQVENFDAQMDSNTLESQTQEGDAQAGAINERSIVTLLVNLKNGVNSTGSLSTTSGDLFDNTLSTARQYETSSNGQLSFKRDTDGDGQADIFGPFTINADASGACDYYDWAYQAEAAAEAAGINLSQYQHKVFVLPKYDQLSQCNWAGIANVSCGDSCRAWIAYNHGGLYSHELGHNFGMKHSGLDSDNNGSAENSYGDFSGVMGSPYYNNHFNAPHKLQMGWLAGYAGSSIDVTGVGAGSYSIGSLELDQRTDNPGVQALVHPRAAGGKYYASFRQTIGNFGVHSDYHNKLSIHSHAGGVREVLFIKALSAGETFTDNTSKFSVTFHGYSGNFANVSVNSNWLSSTNCSTSAPSVSLSPSSQSGVGGDTFSYTLSLKNNDSSDCSTSTFNLAADTGSLVSALSASSLSLAPGTSGSATLKVSTSLSSSEGDYRFSTSVKSSGHSAVSSTGLLTLDNSTPTTPTNLTGNAKRKALELSWSASSDSGSGVAYYRVFRNGTKVAERGTATYSDRDLVSGNSYSYYVDAVDHAGQISSPSNTFSYAAASGGGGGGNKGKKPSK